MNVSNRKCIRNLSLKSLRAAKTRNIVAVLAIALTTVLFTALFTIALSINEGFQQSNFRQVGRLPQEGTNEAATDTHVLELLGVKPEIGAEFTVTFDVDGTPVTETFTLCGWWEYDEAIVANHILLPLSRAETILAEAGVISGQSRDGMTGSWNMDVMLKSGSRHIERDLAAGTWRCC